MADTTVVQIYGNQELIKKMEYLGGFISSPRFRAVLNDAGQYYVDRAKASAPISRNPGSRGLIAGGALRSSINYDIQNFGTYAVTLRVGAGGPGARYASYVEFGTEPHGPILPVRAQAMHWMEDGAGRSVNFNVYKGRTTPKNWSDVFAKSITQHPGTRAQPFFFEHLQPTVDRLMMALQRVLTEQMNRGTP